MNDQANPNNEPQGDLTVPELEAPHEGVASLEEAGGFIEPVTEDDLQVRACGTG